MADSDNRRQVQDFFGKHASAYAGNLGKDLERLIALLAPTGTEAALDVATATGSTALALAPLVAAVTGLDLTPAMGREFAAQAAQQGVGNARFIEGDVAHLPFAGGSFDIVTCRRAAHHFPDVPAARRALPAVAAPVVRHNPDGTVTFLKQRVIAVAVKGGR